MKRQMYRRYKIKAITVTTPEVELPDGSQVVSIEHHDAYGFIDDKGPGLQVPEMWKITYLELTEPYPREEKEEPK